MSDVNRNEYVDDYAGQYWQQIYFKYLTVDTSSKKCDALRSLISESVHCQKNGAISQDCLKILTSKLTSCNANIVDCSDASGLNNYAEVALSLSAYHKNESREWKTSEIIESTINKFIGDECARVKQEADEIEDAENFLLLMNSDKNLLVDEVQSRKSLFADMTSKKQLEIQVTKDCFDRMSTSSACGSVFTENTGRKFRYENNSQVISNEGRCPSNRVPSDIKPTSPDQQPTIVFFKTAKDQLALNNNKRFKGADKKFNGSVNQSAYGSNKKCLGTRVGAGSKFNPPVMKQSETNNDAVFTGKVSYRKENSNVVTSTDDNNLKSVDPKMVELIRNEIMDYGAPVSWDDIAGLEFAKKTVKEIVVWPMIRPDLFKGLRGPPKGLLLFGPPGTGKTLIGKCVASQSKATFFNISASSLTSKWVGDGEKMVRALFAVARCHLPSVIFIDEIDSLLTQRSESEHESSRRIKTEFLIQLDGASTSDDERLLIIGATNRPQELDEAARRRLVKRLYIPLPEAAARKQIITKLMKDQIHELNDSEIDEISVLTAGYSGADMTNLCKEAALGPIRCLHTVDIEHVISDQVRPIRFQDFKQAAKQVRASVSSDDLHSYLQWNELFGSCCGSY